MIGRVITYDGISYDLPRLLSWELTRTGGVPCDSFRVTCTGEAGMTALLPKMTRFRAVEGGKSIFYGVIDDYTVSCGDNGMRLEITGRGMAALLLDNEAEAVDYQNATLREIVRRHVQPLGIECILGGGADRAFAYTVPGGASQWKALEGFALLCGVQPYFTKDGILELREKHRGERLSLTDGQALRSALYREKRCGVISEITVIDRVQRRRETVKNEDLCERGGLCRRVLYMPRGSSLRRNGAYQIARSRRGSRLLVMAFSGRLAAEPGDIAQVNCRRLGIREEFCVSEVMHSFSSAGEITEVTFQEAES